MIHEVNLLASPNLRENWEPLDSVLDMHKPCFDEDSPSKSACAAETFCHCPGPQMTPSSSG